MLAAAIVCLLLGIGFLVCALLTLKGKIPPITTEYIASTKAERRHMRSRQQARFVGGTFLGLAVLFLLAAVATWLALAWLLTLVIVLAVLLALAVLVASIVAEARKK
ncbi:MAG: DUF3784 domain-containing protein [Ruminococcaceae bacterium]|nr:DUF3784 domain-containing protein [Oscillospiraceae bacterium]